MDTIIGIFTALGVDSTVFTQFALVVALFFLLKFVLFGKLQEVLELRESKTTKLDSNANKKFAEAESLGEKYEAEINSAYSEGQKIFSEMKVSVVDREKSKFKKAETEVNEEADKKRAEIATEIAAHKTKVMSNADSLSNDLVNKLTN